MAEATIPDRSTYETRMVCDSCESEIHSARTMAECRSCGAWCCVDCAANSVPAIPVDDDNTIAECPACQ